MGAALTGLVGFLAIFERSTFVFDRDRRQLCWERQRAWGKRSGVEAFEDIRSVATPRPLGDDGTPSRRVVLLLKEQELPLSIGYAPDPDGACLLLADTIRQFIGEAPLKEDVMVRVREAVNRGAVIVAIRLLREEKQLSLTEAKQRVDEMRA